MEEAASIIIHLDCYDAIKCLPDELAGVLFKSILCYGATGELPKIDDKSLLALFNMFKAQRDRDKKKYEQKCEKNRENARRRYSSQSDNHPPDAIASKRMPSQANASISNNSNQKNNSIDDIANANNINMESNPSLIQSNGIYDSIPRIGKQEKRQRDVLSTATKVIAGFSSCFIGDSPCLRLLDITYGMFASAIWLVPQIADVSVSCGLKEDASEVQIQLVAAAIASKYKYLRTDEIMLFLFNFKAGFYEQFYCYFDPQTIIRSMPTFLQERTNIIEEYNKELRRIEAEKNRLPGTPLEEINMHYFKTETLNKLLHLHY